MKGIHVILLSFSSFLFWQCGMQTDIASNYYDDGIYFDPAYGNLLLEIEEASNDTTYTVVEDDYYVPGEYTSPYDEGDVYTDMGAYSSFSQSGWNTGFSVGLGYTWGNPMFGSDYYPYGGYGGYPGYGYSGYGGYGGYNPYCPGYGGYGYGGYPGYGYGSYPPYGYGGYPSSGNNSGNDFGGYWNSGNKPAVVYRGNAGPRGGRNNTGSTSSTHGTRPDGGRLANTPPKPGTQDQNPVEKSSKLRQTATAPKTTSNTNYLNRSESTLYEKASGKAVTATRGTNTLTNGRSTPQRATNVRSSTNNLVRQTNRVLSPQSSGRANNTGSTIRSTVTRSANVIRSSSGGSSTMQRSRPSSGSSVRGSSGGAVRGTSTTTRMRK